VEYYEKSAQGDPSKIYLFHELAELYLQLTKYTDAIRVLQEAINLTRDMQVRT
jgi:tetratricopeptide (TPR) repeat protein